MFHLLVQITAFGSTVLGVICGECKYEVHADSHEEHEKLTQASRLWAQHERGELDAAAFTSALEALDSTTLAKIIEDARTWTCPACKHGNALHFVTCWNCQYERPLNDEEQRLEQVDGSDSDADGQAP
ncbi:MAG: hypothetical protein ACREIA_25930 [Opitutaceae bacterium]